MLDLLASANKGETNKEYNFFLRGDLSQMSKQREFLSIRGFDLKQNKLHKLYEEIRLSETSIERKSILNEEMLKLGREIEKPTEIKKIISYNNIEQG